MAEAKPATRSLRKEEQGSCGQASHLAPEGWLLQSREQWHRDLGGPEQVQPQPGWPATLSRTHILLPDKLAQLVNDPAMFSVIFATLRIFGGQEGLAV